MKSFVFSYLDSAWIRELLIFPIMISSEQIKKFQALYKKYFGGEIDTEEAYQSAAKLLRLVQIIYKPMTQEEFEMVQRWEAEIKKKFPREN